MQEAERKTWDVQSRERGFKDADAEARSLGFKDADDLVKYCMEATQDAICGLVNKLRKSSSVIDFGQGHAQGSASSASRSTRSMLYSPRSRRSEVPTST